jgi:hypothetical protein
VFCDRGHKVEGNIYINKKEKSPWGFQPSMNGDISYKKEKAIKKPSRPSYREKRRHTISQPKCIVKRANIYNRTLSVLALEVDGRIDRGINIQIAFFSSLF